MSDKDTIPHLIAGGQLLPAPPLVARADAVAVAAGLGCHTELLPSIPAEPVNLRCMYTDKLSGTSTRQR
jgi:hypothetical protein